VLYVDGQLTSPTTTVQSGGTLGGVGTIIGAVTNSGSIAPGNSIGTLNIVGSYTQASGSQYTTEVTATPTVDLVNITGPATIQPGAGVNVLAAPGTYTVGQRYTILTASGGVSGTYSTLTDNAPFVDFGLFYDPNNVYLDVTRASAAFASIARTPNQRAAATGVESLGSGNAIFDAVLSLDTPNALRAFDLLSGEIHASIQSALLDDSRFVREAILGRLQQFAGGVITTSGPQIIASYASEDRASPRRIDRARGRPPAQAAIDAAVITEAPPAAGPALTVWSHGFGSFGSFESDGNAAAMRRRTGGIISGIDATHAGTLAQDWRAGVAGGYQAHSLTVGDRASSASVDTYHVAAYAGVRQGPFALRLGAAHAWHSIDTNRNIRFPGFSDITTAKYDGRTGQLFGEFGYALTYRALSLEPYAALAYVRVRSDGFVENGGAAALTSTAALIDTTFSTLGARGTVPLAVDGARTVLLKGGVGWRHAFDATAPALQFAFAGGSPFVVAGVPIARDALITEAGLDVATANDMTIGISYSGQTAGSAREYGIKGHAIKRF
jgi:outer membrane autotransporter protein